MALNGRIASESSFSAPSSQRRDPVRPSTAGSPAAPSCTLEISQPTALRRPARTT